VAAIFGRPRALLTVSSSVALVGNLAGDKAGVDSGMRRTGSFQPAESGGALRISEGGAHAPSRVVSDALVGNMAGDRAGVDSGMRRAGSFQPAESGVALRISEGGAHAPSRVVSVALVGNLAGDKVGVDSGMRRAGSFQPPESGGALRNTRGACAPLTSYPSPFGNGNAAPKGLARTRESRRLFPPPRPEPSRQPSEHAP